MSFSFDSVEMAARGRVGGLTTIVRHGPEEIAQRARNGLWARFEFEVDPEGILPPAERARRAEYARRLHMARLALKSARSRSAHKKAAADQRQPAAALDPVEVADHASGQQLQPA